jgi:hypothetical protein
MDIPENLATRRGNPEWTFQRTWQHEGVIQNGHSREPTPSCCLVLWNVHSGLPLRVARFSGLSILDYPFVLPGSLDCPFFITPSVSLTFIETHKKIFFLSLWQTNRRIEQIYKDFG